MKVSSYKQYILQQSKLFIKFQIFCGSYKPQQQNFINIVYIEQKAQSSKPKYWWSRKFK